MMTLIKHLVWREFRELRSGTLSATAVAVSIPLCYVLRDVSAAYFGIFPTLWFYPFAAGVFFGMRAAAGERTAGSATFAASLPVSHRMLGGIRLATSVAGAALPLVALLLLGLMLWPFADQYTRASVPWLTIAFGASLLATTCCLTLVATAGTGQPSEVRAGMVGIGAILAVGLLGWLVLVGLLFLLSRLYLVWPFPRPNGEAFVFVIACLLAGGATVFAACFVNNYSRAVAPGANRPADSWLVNAWIPNPISAPVAALLWKNAREMAALGFCVFLGAASLSVIAGTLETIGKNSQNPFEVGMHIMPFFLWAGGFLLAILVGIGSAIADLQSDVNTFWRSRPISPHAWYWTKFVTGLMTILLAVEVPFILSPHAQLVTDFESGFVWWPLIWNVTFSFALTFTCLVRQPAHAAILAVGTAGILYAMIQAAFGSFTPGEPPAPTAILAAGFLVAFAVSTFVGYIVAVRDLVIS